MEQWTANLLDWMVSDCDRDRVKIKYELKLVEFQLKKLLERYTKIEECFVELSSLVAKSLNSYSEYLRSSGINPQVLLSESSNEPMIDDWKTHLAEIFSLQTVKHGLTDLELIKSALVKYHELLLHLQQYQAVDTEPVEIDECFDPFHLLSHESQATWLEHLIALWNKKHKCNQDVGVQFDSWSFEEVEQGMEFMSRSAIVDLANAIFFYKLFPDRLFQEFIHPEKLVSVSMRLGVLHSMIEQIHKLLTYKAQQLGIERGVDHFFHGGDLPQGILIEVSDELNRLIQIAVKELKVKNSKESEGQITDERMNDLRLAYKFWFNPNRFIDAAMVLHQRLVGHTADVDLNLFKFQRGMCRLYSRWTSSECLDLYGYYANHDTHYLLYILYLIKNGHRFEWLHALDVEERATVSRVYDILTCVIEALRDELKARHVLTEPYIYDLNKETVHAGRRNREAVQRLISIYNASTIEMSDSLEKLFAALEGRE